MYRTDLRVAQGGIFHSAKVKYNPETHAIIKELLNESKLTILQRQKVEECVRRGEPLPAPRSRSARPERSQLVPKPPPKRRSLQAILQSGALVREDLYCPKPVKVDHEKEKARLQSMMAFGKNLPPEPISVKKRAYSARPRLTTKKTDDEIKHELFNELLKGMKERHDFLEEMEALGCGKLYRSQIKLEIDEKVRQMRELDKQKYLQSRDIIAKYQVKENAEIKTLSETCINPSPASSEKTK